METQTSPNQTEANDCSCGRSFTSRRGLSLHQNHCEPGTADWESIVAEAIVAVAEEEVLTQCPFCSVTGSQAGVKRHVIARHHEDWRVTLPTGVFPRTRSGFVKGGGAALIKICEGAH